MHDDPPSFSPHFRAVRLLGCRRCRWADARNLDSGHGYCNGPSTLSIHPRSGRCLSARPIPNPRVWHPHPTSPGPRRVEVFNPPAPHETLN